MFDPRPLAMACPWCGIPSVGGMSRALQPANVASHAAVRPTVGPSRGV